MKATQGENANFFGPWPVNGLTRRWPSNLDAETADSGREKLCSGSGSGGLRCASWTLVFIPSINFISQKCIVGCLMTIHTKLAFHAQIWMFHDQSAFVLTAEQDSAVSPILYILQKKVK